MIRIFLLYRNTGDKRSSFSAIDCTFFFISLKVSCEILNLSLVPLLCGDSSRNSNFNPFLGRSRMFFWGHLFSILQNKLCCLLAIHQLYLLISYYLFKFQLYIPYLFPKFLCWNFRLCHCNYCGFFSKGIFTKIILQGEVFEVFLIALSFAKISSSVFLVICTVIWRNVNITSFVAGFQPIYSVLKIIT